MSTPLGRLLSRVHVQHTAAGSAVVQHTAAGPAVTRADNRWISPPAIFPSVVRTAASPAVIRTAAGPACTTVNNAFARANVCAADTWVAAVAAARPLANSVAVARPLANSLAARLRANSVAARAGVSPSPQILPRVPVTLFDVGGDGATIRDFGGDGVTFFDDGGEDTTFRSAGGAAHFHYFDDRPSTDDERHRKVGLQTTSGPRVVDSHIGRRRRKRGGRKEKARKERRLLTASIQSLSMPAVLPAESTATVESVDFDEGLAVGKSVGFDKGEKEDDDEDEGE